MATTSTKKTTKSKKTETKSSPKNNISQKTVKKIHTSPVSKETLSIPKNHPISHLKEGKADTTVFTAILAIFIVAFVVL